ncbi:MAG: Hsp20 family protein [Desulfobacterales bacterium]
MLYKRSFNVPTWGFSRAFRELYRLHREMDALYSALSCGALPMPSAGVFPLTNLTEDSENYYLKAELPGINSDELDIQVTPEGIFISGRPDKGSCSDACPGQIRYSKYSHDNIIPPNTCR